MYDSAMVGNFEDIIGEKIVETLSSNGVASKNKRSTPLHYFLQISLRRLYMDIRAKRVN